VAGLRGCCGEVELQHVLFDYADLLRGKLNAEKRGQVVIELDREDVGSFFGEYASDGALTRTDFDDGLVAEIPERSGDALNGAVIAKEVLAELGFVRHGCL